MADAKKTWWSLSLNDVLTFLISGAGFVVVILGLYANNKAVNANTYLQTFVSTYDIDKAFIDHPELKHYFEGDTIKKSDTIVYERARAISELMLDNYDAILNNESYFKDDRQTEIFWKDYICHRFKQSRILREKYAEDAVYYGDTLKSIYNRSVDTSPHDIVW